MLSLQGGRCIFIPSSFCCRYMYASYKERIDPGQPAAGETADIAGTE